MRCALTLKYLWPEPRLGELKKMEPITNAYIAAREHLIRVHRAHIGLEKALILTAVAILAYGSFRMWTSGGI